MQTSTNNTESKTDSTTQGKVNSGYVAPETKIDDKPVDDGLDDYGYKKTETKSDDNKQELEKADDDKKKVEEDDKVKDPSTGYLKKEEDKKTDEEVKKTEEEDKKTDEEEKEVDFSESLKELPETVDKDKLVAFAKEQKLTKEQLSAYTKLVAAEEAQFAKDQAAAKVKQESEWSKELSSDPDFIGEKGEDFEANVIRSEKVLEKFMPNMKKVLTEKGGMLPPYIMKDLLNLHKALNPTNELVTGEAGSTKESTNDFLTEMYK